MSSTWAIITTARRLRAEGRREPILPPYLGISADGGLVLDNATQLRAYVNRLQPQRIDLRCAPGEDRAALFVMATADLRHRPVEFDVDRLPLRERVERASLVVRLAILTGVLRALRWMFGV